MSEALHGAIVVDKPGGPTSHDVVARLRRWVKPSRAGHTGTLDPMATGVLAVCVGAATRLSRFLARGPKEYTGRLILGVATDSYDAEGTVVARHSTDGIDLERVRRAAARLTGDLMQVPPAWSAKKVGGTRAHDLARSGGAAKLEACRVSVYAFDPTDKDGDEVPFRVACSPGTYVRSLVQDLGAALGCGAHLASLRRVRSGPFHLDQAATLDVLEEAGREGALRAHLVSLEDLDLGLETARLKPEGLRSAVAGRRIPRSEAHPGGGDWPPGGSVRLLDQEGRLVGIAEPVGGDPPGLQPRVILAGALDARP